MLKIGSPFICIFKADDDKNGVGNLCDDDDDGDGIKNENVICLNSIQCISSFQKKTLPRFFFVSMFITLNFSIKQNWLFPETQA